MSDYVTCVCGGQMARRSRMCWACRQKDGYKHGYDSPIKPFWDRVEMQGGVDACWTWIGAVNLRGYGRYGRGTLAHREAYALTFGPIQGGLHVCHRCDNPPCCNPAHLFLGTNADNVADRVAKGRPRFGQDWHCAKLTNEQVRHIRDSSESTGDLAFRYGVSYSAVQRVRLRLSYKRVA